MKRALYACLFAILALATYSYFYLCMTSGLELLYDLAVPTPKFFWPLFALAGSVVFCGGTLVLAAMAYAAWRLAFDRDDQASS